MNKLLKIIIATLGGIEAVFSIAVPILLAIIWIRISLMVGWSSYVLLSAGILATIFRGIKIGFMKNE